MAVTVRNKGIAHGSTARYFLLEVTLSNSITWSFYSRRHVVLYMIQRMEVHLHTFTQNTTINVHVLLHTRCSRNFDRTWPSLWRRYAVAKVGGAYVHSRIGPLSGARSTCSLELTLVSASAFDLTLTWLVALIGPGPSNRPAKWVTWGSIPSCKAKIWWPSLTMQRKVDVVVIWSVKSLFFRCKLSQVQHVLWNKSQMCFRGCPVAFKT